MVWAAKAATKELERKIGEVSENRTLFMPRSSHELK